MNMIEIERKFLIVSDKYKEQAYKKTRIVQGFLNTHKERTVRVRIKGEEALYCHKRNFQYRRDYQIRVGERNSCRRGRTTNRIMRT